MLLEISHPFELTGLIAWIDSFLHDLLPSWLAQLVEYVAIGVVVLAMFAIIALFLIYMERKVTAFFQCRYGPNRVGKWGIIQSVADMIKILLKEVIHIDNVDKFLFYLSPFFVICASMMTFAALPFGDGLHVVDFKVGVFYLLGISSMSIIGVLLAGWSSNNKYSVIGAMRSGAQFVSYELSAGLALMTVCVMAGSLQLSTIVADQQYITHWNIVRGHIPAIIAFIIYMISGHAETNRGPFDLPEAESELTAGYHTEYSGLQFGFYYLAEYLNMFIIAGIATTMFLGGWNPIQVEGWDGFNQVMNWLPSFGWFFAKAFFLVFLSLWVRWTFPRLRIDQLLNLEWKYLLPINLVNLMIMVIIVVFGLYIK